MLEAKSVVSSALVVVCPRCQELPGEPCKRSDGTLVSFKGHLGVHFERLQASRGARRERDA
jgi:hypothetical protein